MLYQLNISLQMVEILHIDEVQFRFNVTQSFVVISEFQILCHVRFGTVTEWQCPI